jgi:3-phenylpropionate/trans-cinnamate dioxygenase ferredoxin subunit
MTRYVVGRISEFAPGSRKIVSIAGRSVGIFYIDGEFYAIQNRCPHAGAPLCQGALGGVVKSPGPGQYDYSRPNEFIRCPWHSWEFDLKTGRSFFDPGKVRVKTFETSLVSQCANDAADSPAHASDPPAPGSTFLAETYPVIVEETYVQVDI